MKIAKAVVFVLFLMAIFFCVKVYFNEPVPREIAVYQPITHGLVEKVTDKTGTRRITVEGMRVSASTYCMYGAFLWDTCIH